MEAVRSDGSYPIPNLELRLVVSKQQFEVLPDANLQRALSSILHPTSVEQRLSIKENILTLFHHSEQSSLAQAAVMAATGREVHALYPDRSDIRIKKIQWRTIEELARLDGRFNRNNPEYDDSKRLHIHTEIERTLPDIREVFDKSFVEPNDKYAVIEILLEDFPYFKDSLSSAQSDYGIDEATRRSLERLYIENRIKQMYERYGREAKWNIPGIELSVFEKETIQKLGGGIGKDGLYNPGKIAKALFRHIQLQESDLPNSEMLEHMATKSAKPSNVVELFHAASHIDESA